MALKWWDGLDHYAGGADMLSRSSFVQYNHVDGGLVTGRNGHGKELDGNARITAVVAQRVAEAGIGASIVTGGSDISISLADTVANSTQVLVVFRVRNYSIEIYRGDGSTLLYRSANNVWGQTQNFIEVWAKIDPAAGYVTVHMNQQVVATVTGQNTQQTANAWWDGFSMSGGNIDDLYYADTTTGPGSFPCNTFIGDPRVYTLFPTANAAVMLTPLANTNWQEVSEVAFDGDVSYNYSPNVNDEDTFTIGPLPSTATSILGLQITGAFRKDDAGLREVKQALKSGATEVYGATYSLADTTYEYFSDIWPLDPNTSANWTRANVNAANIGYRVAA